MFLHLRWYNIDVKPYRMRPINTLLPRKDVEDLELIKKRFKIPYTEIIRRGIFGLKENHWTDYYRWKNGTHPPRFRKDSIREEMEEKFKESFLDPEYNYRKIEFSPRKPGERIRICLSMAEGDLQFLKASTKREGTISSYLSYLVHTMGYLKTVPSEDEVPLNSFRISQYVGHKKITFGIRMEDKRF